jgi:hypothetical protein
MQRLTWLWVALSIGCGGEIVGDTDAGRDAGRIPGTDAGTDAGGNTGVDAGMNEVDGGMSDGGMTDGGMSDGGMSDPDAGMLPTCTTNTECEDTEFCAAAVCGAVGTCEPRPTPCEDVDAPVCGCDGVTYGNSCEANAAGVNVAMRGACDTGSCGMTPGAGCCFEDGDCGTRSQRCVLEMCTAGGAGVCVTNLLGRDECWENADCLGGETCEGERICACGGLCGPVANAPGTCMPPAPVACRDNSACGATEYCEKRVGDCGGEGVCTPRPEICTRERDPMCGCDGMTYGNPCEASRAGVNVSARGACDVACDLRPRTGCCFDDADCTGAGQRCAEEVCRSTGEGTCVSTTALGRNDCWEDSDCGFGGSCRGASICDCGVRCLLPDEPGTCVSIGIP